MPSTLCVVISAQFLLSVNYPFKFLDLMLPFRYPFTEGTSLLTKLRRVEADFMLDFLSSVGF